MNIQAHRGLWNHAIKENSLSSFEDAFKRGFSVEVDVRRTKEGLLVMSHDSNTQRLYATNREIPKTESKDIKFLCTFDAFLDSMEKSSVKSNAIHIKDINEEGVLDKACKEITRRKLKDKCVIYTNDEQSVPLIDFCKNNYPEIKVAIHISSEKHRTPEEIKRADVMWIDEPRGERWVKKEMISKYHALKKPCFIISPEIITPTIKTKDIYNVWSDWISWGIDGICTDIPLELQDHTNRNRRND